MRRPVCPFKTHYPDCARAVSLFEQGACPCFQHRLEEARRKADGSELLGDVCWYVRHCRSIPGVVTARQRAYLLRLVRTNGFRRYLMAKLGMM